MANKTIKVIDFNDKEEKTYRYSDHDTFGDLKRNIAAEERYQGTENVEMFLACIPLPDDLHIKDVIDMEENGFFIEFPNYPSVTAREDTYVWAGKYNCTKLYAGHQETIRVRRNGHFGVARISLGEGKYDARVYQVKQNWKLEIEGIGLDAKVYRINGNRTLLEPDCLKTYDINLRSGITHEQVRDVIKTFGLAVRAARPVAIPVLNAVMDTDEGMDEDPLPSGGTQRSFWDRCKIL